MVAGTQSREGQPRRKGELESQSTFLTSPTHHTPTTLQIYALPEGCLQCLFQSGQLSLRRGINSGVDIPWSLAKGAPAGATFCERLFASATYTMMDMLFALSALSSMATGFA